MAPFHERRTERRLEIGKRLGHRRLRAVYLDRGTAEAFQPRDRFEHAQVPETRQVGCNHGPDSVVSTVFNPQILAWNLW